MKFLQCVSLQETVISDTDFPCPNDYFSYHMEYEPARGVVNGVRYLQGMMSLTHS